MDIRTIKNFLKLTEHLNYRRTADEILLAQPALSRQIKQMETEIGAVLFDRNKRNVTLTEGGQYFRNEMERLVMQWEAACRKTAQIHRGEAGDIRIGHASSVMQSVLPRILAILKQEYPDLHTILSETANLHLIENLRQRTIDIGFAPNVIPFNDIESMVLYEENFVLILPENHPIDVHTPLSWKALCKEKFIIPSLNLGVGYVETLHQIFYEQIGFLPETVHESAYSTSVLRLVEAGIGISIEPKSTLKGWNIGVKSIELTDIPQKAAMQMLWLKDRAGEFGLFFEVVKNIILS
jgi:DNA-binding transcriptional LysR family regulator